MKDKINLRDRVGREGACASLFNLVLLIHKIASWDSHVIQIGKEQGANECAVF